MMRLALLQLGPRSGPSLCSHLQRSLYTLWGHIWTVVIGKVVVFLWQSCSLALEDQEKLKHIRGFGRSLLGFLLNIRILQNLPFSHLQTACGPCPVSWILTCLCLPGKTEVMEPQELLLHPSRHCGPCMCGWGSVSFKQDFSPKSHGKGGRSDSHTNGK